MKQWEAAGILTAEKLPEWSAGRPGVVSGRTALTCSIAIKEGVAFDDACEAGHQCSMYSYLVAAFSPGSWLPCRPQPVATCGMPELLGSAEGRLKPQRESAAAGSARKQHAMLSNKDLLARLDTKRI